MYCVEMDNFATTYILLSRIHMVSVAESLDAMKKYYQLRIY